MTWQPRANPKKGTPTKEEHDAYVDKHGVSFTHHWMKHLDPPRPKKEDKE